MYGRGNFYPYYGMNNIGMSSNFGFGPNRGLSNIFGFGRNTGRGLGSLFGLGHRSFSRINLSNILTGVQKTLNVVNQAIPVVKEAGPMFNNMKTMFKLASAFKDVDEKDNSKESITTKTKKIDNNIYEEINNEIKEKEINTPNFFI